MMVGESTREYVANTKALAGTVRYHGTDVMAGLHPGLTVGFRVNYTTAEQEHALFNVEGLNTIPDGLDGYALAAGFKAWNN